jgi:hypothetical protein
MSAPFSAPPQQLSPGPGAPPAGSWTGAKPNRPLRGSRVGGGRRRVPYLVMGALLVVVCAATAVITVMQVGRRTPVVVLANAVTVGHVMTAQDLRVVPVGADTGTDVIPAEQASSVLGQRVAYSLPAGTLLSRAALGRAQVPADGQSLMAVAVKPGQFPPALAAGTTVSLIPVPGTNSNAPSSSGGPWTAIVTDVQPQAADQTTVISLQIPENAAAQVAAIPSGQLSVIVVPGGGR